MARAHRIHIPGQVWHLTHRCHRRQFGPCEALALGSGDSAAGTDRQQR